MIRVLIAEDSPTIRVLLAETFAQDPEITVAGHARNGAEAVELTRSLRPDVVTMDIQMPVMDGFEATRQIMSEVPTPIVIISGSESVDEVAFSMQALRMGALSVLQKPVGPGSPDFVDACRRILSTVKTMAGVRVARRGGGASAAEPAPPSAPGLARRQAPVAVVGVVASTGGPPALQALLGGLPDDFEPPVLIVQHMSQGFVAGFASWLAGTTGRRVVVATDGAGIEKGGVYIAAEGAHLTLGGRATLRLDRSPAVGGFRPAGDVLLRSVAERHGAAAVGVVLTGMGRDGVEGLARLKASGGYTIAQDRTSCVVFGMPGAAWEAGVVDELLGIGAIAKRLDQLARGGAAEWPGS